MTFVSFLINCAISAPFQKSSQFDKYNVNDNTEVVVALTEVEIHGSLLNQLTFWRRVSSVRSNIESNNGYLAGSIRREIFGSNAWTMTVWKDEDSIDNFIYSQEHERAMKEGAPAVKKGRFFRIRKQWRELPLAWEEAINLVHEEGRIE